MKIIRICNGILIFVLCLFIFNFYLNVSGLGENPKASLVDLLQGTAFTPYQYRILVPGIINILLSFVPETGCCSKFVMDQQELMIQISGSIEPGQTEFCLAILIMFFSFVGSVYLLGKLMNRLGYTEIKQEIFLLLYPLIIISTFLYAYIYDFPHLFLFSCGLFILAPSKNGTSKPKSDWIFYILIFTLATLNKETSILFVLIFGIVYWKQLSKPVFIGLFFIQIMIFTAIRVILFQQYGNNPGGFVEFHLWDHISLYENFPLITLIIILVIILLSIRVNLGWKDKPLFLRQSLIIFLPLIPLYFFFGFPYEFRVFLEVYPIIYLLIIPHKQQIAP